MSLFDKIVVLLLVLLIASCGTPCANSVGDQEEEKIYIASGKTHVFVYNEMDDSNFIIQCKSGDDDLGAHVIAPGQNYEWNFKVNIWKSTLFYCSVSCTHGSGVFDLYKAKRDLGRCKKNCIWRVRKDGVFGYTNQDVEGIVYRWSKP